MCVCAEEEMGRADGGLNRERLTSERSAAAA